MPLDSPLDVVRDNDGSVRVLEGEALVAVARSAPELHVDVPAPLSLDEARRAAGNYRDAPGLSPRARSGCGIAGSDVRGLRAGLDPGALSRWPAFGRSRAPPARSRRGGDLADGSLLLIAGARSPALLYVGRFVVGLGSGAAFSAGTAWLRELSLLAPGNADSARAARRAAVAMTTGFAVGPLVSGLLAQWAGEPGSAVPASCRVHGRDVIRVGPARARDDHAAKAVVARRRAASRAAATAVLAVGGGDRAMGVRGTSGGVRQAGLRAVVPHAIAYLLVKLSLRYLPTLRTLGFTMQLAATCESLRRQARRPDHRSLRASCDRSAAALRISAFQPKRRVAGRASSRRRARSSGAFLPCAWEAGDMAAACLVLWAVG